MRIQCKTIFYRRAEIVFCAAFSLRIPSKEIIPFSYRQFRFSYCIFIPNIYSSLISAFIILIEDNGICFYLPPCIHCHIVCRHGITSPLYAALRTRIIIPSGKFITFPGRRTFRCCNRGFVFVSTGTGSVVSPVCRKLYRIGVPCII